MRLVIVPGRTSKDTPPSAATPPKSTPSSSTARLIRLPGGPDMAPRPPTLGRAPAKPWRASGSAQGGSPPGSRQRRYDAARQEVDEENEQDAVGEHLPLPRDGLAQRLRQNREEERAD